MTKFSSIWGDIEVNNVTPADTREDKPAGASAAPSKVEDEVEDEVEDNEEQEEQSTQSSSKDSNSPEELVIEDEEEFVGKAYAILKKEGVLELTEEEEAELDASSSGLADAVAATIRNKYIKEIQATPKIVQDLYAHVMAGNDYSTFKPDAAFSWENADIEDEEVKKQALKLLYLEQGMTEEDADAEVEDVASSDKFDRKAELAIDVLIKKEQKDRDAQEALEAKAAEQAEQARLKEIQEIEKSIDSSEEIAGFKLDDKKKKGFKDYLFKVNPRTGKTQFLENMGSQERKLKIAFLDYVNYTKADLETEVATALSKERKKKLSSYSDKNIASTSSGRSVKSNVDSGKGKIIFPSIFGKQTVEVED